MRAAGESGAAALGTWPANALCVCFPHQITYEYGGNQPTNYVIANVTITLRYLPVLSDRRDFNQLPVSSPARWTRRTGNYNRQPHRSVRLAGGHLQCAEWQRRRRLRHSVLQQRHAAARRRVLTSRCQQQSTDSRRPRCRHRKVVQNRVTTHSSRACLPAG